VSGARTGAPRFGSLLHHFGGRLLAALDELSPEILSAPERRLVLPVVAGLLQGRRAADEGGAERAWREFGGVGARLALLACPTGPPQVRLLDFARRQRRRFAVGAEAGKAEWAGLEDVHHFDRALAHGVRVAYLLDAGGDGAARRSLPDEAADAANYLLFFLAVRGLVPAAA